MSVVAHDSSKKAPPLPKPKDQRLWNMANAVRALCMDGVEKAKSGHPGMPMGMADVATVLFSKYLKVDPTHPTWPDRDRFVLSAGHGSMLLYSLLHLTGYEEMTLDELKQFRQLNAKTAGHPEYGFAHGIETTTGPLGQGIATSVGMALAERILNATYGDDLVDHRTWVICGDGCLMEGVSHEAISLAGHLRLNKLVCFWDDNSITIDGSTDLSVSDDQVMRFKACGWNAERIDGHDTDQIQAAIDRAMKSDKPYMIACKTTIAFGAPTKAGTSASHGAPLGPDEIKGARERLGWTAAPFEIPDDVRHDWSAAGIRCANQSKAWRDRLAKAKPEIRSEFERRQKGELAKSTLDALQNIKNKFAAEGTKLATRQVSQLVIDVLAESTPELVGGSADLTVSNLTKAKSQVGIKPGEYKGNYVYYGVREHGMATAMNGIAVHGGLIPYGGAFMIFSDYCRPAMRLSAIMHARVIYIMTHDSIGLGEDGPTHQPVEHLGALRAIPNMLVLRPGDAVETAECWAIAMQNNHGPSVMALTRQGLPPQRHESGPDNLSAKGGYVLLEADGGIAKRDVTLIGTGSELSTCVDARKVLVKEGINAAVVSMPCVNLFERQSDGYRDSVLGKAPRIGCEAASPFGWYRYCQDFVGMTTFGASAPIEKLYEFFEITPVKLAARAKALVK